MDLPCLKNARRIFAIVSTTSIPTSASKNHGSQCGPSVRGSRLDADHPEKGVLFACRFTADIDRPQLNAERLRHGLNSTELSDAGWIGGIAEESRSHKPRRDLFQQLQPFP